MPITKQTIAIIGAGGNMGSAIAKNVAGGNYRQLLFDKNTEQLGSLSEDIQQVHPKADLVLMSCPHESSWEADIIILDIPKADELEIAEKIHDVAIQKIVVRVAGHFDEESPKAADRLQSRLPYTKIVTVFKHESKPRVIISGNDQDALQSISELLKTAGFSVSITFKPLKTGTH